MPSWLQWGIPFAIAIAAVVLIVVFVQDHQGQNGSESPVSPKQRSVEVRQADATIKQSQAPHTARIVAGVTAAKGLAHAITDWVDHQTKTGAMNGPVKNASCTPVSGSGSDRVALKCTIKAADVAYNFRGVVQPKSGKVTYCQKIDYGPIYNQKVPPLVAACT
jgi:hypothetical protein